MADIIKMRDPESVQDMRKLLAQLGDRLIEVQSEIGMAARGMDWNGSGKDAFVQDVETWAGTMRSLSTRCGVSSYAVLKEVEEWEITSSDFVEGYTPFIKADGDRSGADASDIQQGDHGDCFLMSSMGGIVLNHPEVIEDMIEDLGNGTYRVRFYDKVCDNLGLGPCHYEEHYVIVDGIFPKDLADPKDQVGGTYESWTLIIEKGYRQLLKERGMPIDFGLPLPAIALSAMTGKDCSNILSPSVTIQDLYTAYQRGDAITASSDWFGGPDEYFGPRSPTDERPIIPREHIFFVTNVDPVNNTVTVQNSWGASHQPQFVTMSFQEYQSCFWLTTTNPVV